MSATNAICEICNKKFNYMDELIDHYLDSKIHHISNLNMNLKNKTMREILNLKTVSDSTEISNSTVLSQPSHIIIQSANNNNKIIEATDIKIQESNHVSEKIVRKCDICFVEVDNSYQKYVLHALKEHNPDVAKCYVNDSYILEAILKGGVFKNKSCDICDREISRDVYDYIIHIKKSHSELINVSLKKHIPDKFVISMLLNKNCYSNSSFIIFCECGDSVEVEDYKEHVLLHKMESQAFKNFYGSEQTINNKMTNINTQNNYANINSHNLNPIIKKSSNKCGDVIVNTVEQYNVQPKIFNKITKINDENPDESKNLKIFFCPICETEMPMEILDEHGLLHIYYLSKQQGAKISTTFLCKLCGKNVDLKEFKNHILIHNQEKFKNSSNLNPGHVINKISPNQNNFFNPYKNDDTSYKYNYNTNFFESICSEFKNSINLNSYSNEETSKIINNNKIQNSILSFEKLDDMKKLQDQIEDLDTKLEKLKQILSNYEKEHLDLRITINKKFTGNDFKMSNIEQEMKKLSELEKQINETKIRMDELNKAKDGYNQKFLKYDKEFNKLKLEYAMKNKSQVDFALPSTWTPQIENVVLIDLNKNSKEFSNLRDMFIKTLPNAQIKQITRIQNVELWMNFCFAKYQLSKKGNSTTKLLFHGTRETDPSVIYEGKEEGFDMRYANSGLYGSGIYFHERAAYSDGYKFKTKFSTNCMFIAEVLIGETFESQQNNSLKFPPYKDEKNKIRYDSVKANNDGIYIIYNNMRAYPSYMIKYI